MGVTFELVVIGKSFHRLDDPVVAARDRKLDAGAVALDQARDARLGLFRVVMFEGVLDGESVSITTRGSRLLPGGGEESEEKITGILRGDTLTLFLADRAEPKEFHHTTREEFDKANRKLEMRAKATMTAK